MERWQEKVIDMYNQSLGPRFHYKLFSHLYYNAYNFSKKGDDNMKNQLTLITNRLDNVTFEEVGKIVSYRNIQNSIVYKEKWNLVGKNRRIYEAALERINVATDDNAYIAIRLKEILISGLKKWLLGQSDYGVR
ncbi:15042_t:CDS:2 [Funneliformis caledonium]|uniref:15042_t:CDS:1 n=1 Tax=Funneliformis caledonium TaxID=1117310 RepID=A0A9N9A1R4_9GLOM|nr:15042_t:CDS:2 [Funneliformis caledonium]